jgi:hypothetical protein
MDRELAEKIVGKILSNLNDRRGFHLDDVDENVLKEIKKSWVEIVLKESGYQGP